MGRTTREHRDMPHPKPVDKVELSEKNFKKRFFLVILLFIFGCVALTHGVIKFLSAGEGWTEISARSDAEVNCGEDFVFLYEIGAGTTSSTAESKLVSQTYTDAAVRAYEMFHADQAFSDMQNVYSINHNPNQIVEVDEALYQALELVQEYGDRKIYLGPVYQTYDDMFYCSDDVQIVDFDPYQNEEIAAWYGEIAGFACDAESVNLELLGSNQVRLYVSDDYLTFAEEYGITNYIDFFWMKNAFIVDYLADQLIENGYTHGSISSYDGFQRCLDDRDVSYSFSVFNREGNEVNQAAIWEYTGQKSIVYLRNYMMSEKDRVHYYELQNGEIRTSYLDAADGLCKSAINDFVSYSEEKSCAEILMEISPLYIAESLDGEAVDMLAGKGIYSIYVENGNLMYNEDGVEEETREGIVYMN